MTLAIRIEELGRVRTTFAKITIINVVIMRKRRWNLLEMRNTLHSEMCDRTAKLSRGWTVSYDFKSVCVNGSCKTCSLTFKFTYAGSAPLDPARVGVATRYFEVRGRLRMEHTVVEERSLVQRDGVEVSTLWRERTALEPGWLGPTTP